MIFVKEAENTMAPVLLSATVLPPRHSPPPGLREQP